MRTFFRKAIVIIESAMFWLGFFLCFIGACMSDANATWSETKWFYIVGIGMMLMVVIIANISLRERE